MEAQIKELKKDLKLSADCVDMLEAQLREARAENERLTKEAQDMAAERPLDIRPGDRVRVNDQVYGVLDLEKQEHAGKRGVVAVVSIVDRKVAMPDMADVILDRGGDLCIGTHNLTRIDRD